MKLILMLAMCGLCFAQQATDEEVWKDFAAWSAQVQPLPVGQRKVIGEAFAEYLVKKGVSAEEAQRRFQRAAVIRRGSNEKEAIYWNASFKLGGGPSDPLRLLQESIRKVKPGRALDAGMGRGRNAIYLASLGWETTGYDMSPDALKVAQEYAKQAGVSIKTVEAKHDSFDFGAEQWDLIVCSYNYMGPMEPQWPGVFFKSLRKGGIVVYQSSIAQLPTTQALLDHWKQFDVLRIERMDAGVMDDDWAPSRTNPTVRIVVRKP